MHETEKNSITSSNMTPKEKFDALVRKEVRDLLKRQVYFSREILALISENFNLKRRLKSQNKKFEILIQKFNKLKELVHKKRKL